MPTKLADSQRLDAENRRFTAALNEVDRLERLLEPVFTLAHEVDGRSAQSSATADPDARARSLAEVEEALGVLDASIIAASVSLSNAAKTARTRITSARDSWTRSTQGARDLQARVFRDLHDEGHDPDQYRTLTDQLEVLRTKLHSRGTAESQVKKLLTDRKALLDKLAKSDKDRLNALYEAIREANAVTGGVVVVKPIPAIDRSHITGVVDREVQGQRHLIHAAIDGAEFSTTEFVATARQGATALAAKYKITGMQGQHLVEAGESLFRQIEEIRRRCSTRRWGWFRHAPIQELGRLVQGAESHGLASPAARYN